MAESPNLSVLTCALHYISVGESLIPYCEGKWRISAGGEDATEVWTKSNIVEFIITPATTTKDTLACTFPHARELQERQHSAWLQVKRRVAPALSVGRVQCPSAVHTTPYLDSSAVVETVKVTFAHRNPSLPVALAKPMLTVGLFNSLILRGCVGGGPNTPRGPAT